MSDAPLAKLPPVWASLAFAAVALVWLLPVTTSDMDAFLVPWFDHIVATGPVAAFAHPFGNYTPAYLYLLAAITPLHGLAPAPVLIKALSLAGSGALALAVRHLLVTLDAPQPGRAAALVFAVPSLLLNAELLGQCDALWAGACVMALAAAVGRRHIAMLAWCGVALGFKMQAALIAPFFIAILLQRRVPIHLWLVAPLATAATMLPAWAVGWPAGNLATIYLHQADYSPRLSLNAPNLWAIVQALPGASMLPFATFATAATVAAMGAYLWHFARRPLEGRALLAPALLCPLLAAGLLPHMHERYFFLADVLALALAVTFRDADSWRIVIRVQIGSTAGLMAYLIGIDGLAAIGAVMMILATAELLAPARTRLANLAPA